ncbi:DUF5719 family protein [Microbacterium sp. 179-I 3D4 NHS]|uniref:DUF5719 family protein n=1 Tax=Microbacterium sp. 179-I 3D4 NHS TaxID=3142381 RepID=UPI0039A3EBE9
MSRERAIRIVANGARVAVGAAVAVACVVGTVAAIHAPWPEVAHQAAQVEVTPSPGAPLLVCNGDLRAIGRDLSDPLAQRSAGTPAMTTGSTGEEPMESALSTPMLADPGPLLELTGTVDGRSASLIAAAESLTASAPDLAGFAALPCGESRLDSWLVGGSVATGTKDMIVVTNAAAVASTVTLSIYGESRSERTVVVPANSQAAWPLSSLAAGNAAPVVQVSAEGAPVRAVLQSAFVRTLDPAGIDLQDAVPAAQQHLTVAGVLTFDGEGDNSDMTVLRLLSPSDETQATVTVRATGSASTAEEFTVPLPAGMPQEISLRDLAPGAYSVDITADAPVVAAVRQQEGFGLGSDFAWVTPAPEIDGDALFAVPEGPAAQLHLVSADDGDVTVTLSEADGDGARDVVVPAGSSASVDVDPDAVYLLRSAGPVRAAITMRGEGALAAWPLAQGAGAEQSITVYP